MIIAVQGTRCSVILWYIFTEQNMKVSYHSCYDIIILKLKPWCCFKSLAIQWPCLRHKQAVEIICVIIPMMFTKHHIWSYLASNLNLWPSGRRRPGPSRPMADRPGPTWIMIIYGRQHSSGTPIFGICLEYASYIPRICRCPTYTWYMVYPWIHHVYPSDWKYMVYSWIYHVYPPSIYMVYPWIYMVYYLMYIHGIYVVYRGISMDIASFWNQISRLLLRLSAYIGLEWFEMASVSATRLQPRKKRDLPGKDA